MFQVKQKTIVCVQIPPWYAFYHITPKNLTLERFLIWNQQVYLKQQTALNYLIIMSSYCSILTVFVNVHESHKLQSNQLYPLSVWNLITPFIPSFAHLKEKRTFVICMIYFKLLFNLCISINLFFFFGCNNETVVKKNNKGTTFVLKCAG